MNQSRLEHLLREHHRAAFLWARQCCWYDSEDAKEVLQMTYLKIFEGRAKYGGLAEFRTWLFSVIRYTAIDYAKKKFTYDQLQNAGHVDNNYLGADILDYKQLLSQLPGRQHEVLLLAFYHGMTLTTIAEVTGLHIGTVRTHYERGKQAMRGLILKERV